MNDSAKIDAYIAKHSKWASQLTILRNIFLDTELDEVIKWGSPTYSLNGKLVAGIAAFKNHYAVWFHQGVFFKDDEKVLVNAQEGKTKALRQWRFEENDTIKTQLVKKYVDEAVENCKQGKEVKVERKKEVIIPEELQNAFSKNKALHEAFKGLTPGKQREYAGYVSEAKRDATKQKRIEKITPMIINGVGLHDKYKNC
ncbi:YdeI/OmpD-associated family protein [Patiriisocius hiemis]|uniref:YdeI/OmpD-associated family protein n=1 Tax=Patiriisocius hiemis TaxID=3075604 RepID=A0ABU2YEH6_9FLAO|nr:YdeI/OmpD-associated family protein [Constantimarinum sp. W242]MDT0556599.1 YdeI/OmpD-associated family protein [Constantimarinum sp. W242]